MNWRRTGLLICLLFIAPLAGAQGITFVEDVDEVILGLRRVDLVLNPQGRARIDVLSPTVARVRFNRTGSFSTDAQLALTNEPWVPTPVGVTQIPGQVILYTEQMNIVIDMEPFGITFLRPDNSLIVADHDPAIGWSGSGQIFTTKAAVANEAYFGLGMWGGPLNRRGRTMQLSNTDNFAWTEFSGPHYQNVPFYYGLRFGKAYGIFFNNAATPFFDMAASNAAQLTFGAASGELDYFFFAGPTPEQIAADYAHITGRMPLPPKWSLGYHASRYGWQTRAEIEGIANEFRQRQIPCDALYFDIDYMNQYRMFSWDTVDFPNPAQMNAGLATQGFRSVNILEPAVLNNDPLWNTLDGAGLFLTGFTTASLVNNIFLGDVSWIDFSKSAARTWYRQGVRDFVTTYNISGAWNDLNEPAQNFMPEAKYNFDGKPRSDFEARNLYAIAETSATHQAMIDAYPNKRPFVLSRAGWPGIQRHAATWSGDPLSDWESLRVSIQLSLHMALSGQIHYGHDIGGFLGSPSPELYLRWLQFSVFTPLMRTHNLNTSAPRMPWDFPEPWYSRIKESIEMRYRLLPYLYTLMEEGSRTGMPAVMPTMFAYPEDPGTYQQDEALMFGRDLLVAPVYTTGTTSVQVYLPDGDRWYDFYTDQRHLGGNTITAAAPLTRIPLFVREGAILPWGPVMQHVDQVTSQNLTIDVYPGPDRTFTLYEDDGESFAFKQGTFRRTRMKTEARAGGRIFAFEHASGSYSAGTRHIHVRFHGATPQQQAATLNAQDERQTFPPGVVLDGLDWQYDAATDVLTVHWIDDGTDQRFEIVSQAAAENWNLYAEQ